MKASFDGFTHVFRVYTLPDENDVDTPYCKRAVITHQSRRFVWIEKRSGPPFHGMVKWPRQIVVFSKEAAWEQFAEFQKKRIRLARETILDAERLLKHYHKTLVSYGSTIDP